MCGFIGKTLGLSAPTPPDASNIAPPPKPATVADPSVMRARVRAYRTGMTGRQSTILTNANTRNGGPTQPVKTLLGG